MMTAFLLCSSANSCPVKGGEAVFKARAILSRYFVEENDDEALCQLVDIRWKNRERNLALDRSFTVSPNPSQGTFMVEYDARLGGAELEVCTPLGIKVLTLLLPKGSSKAEVNVSLPSGIYYLKTSDVTGQPFVQKIVIIE